LPQKFIEKLFRKTHMIGSRAIRCMLTDFILAGRIMWMTHDHTRVQKGYSMEYPFCQLGQLEMETSV